MSIDPGPTDFFIRLLTQKFWSDLDQTQFKAIYDLLNPTQVALLQELLDNLNLAYRNNKFEKAHE